MKKFKIYILLALSALLLALLVGCSEADKVNDTNELVVTVKTGPDSYKKNYIYLNAYTLYVVEDITGTHTDPYHYQMYFHTELLPNVDVKP